MRPHIALACCALAVATVAAPARAATPSPADVKAAHEWFDKGSVHHKLAEYAEAIHCYKEAYRLLASEPIYLYNIAVAYRQLGDAANAVRYYELYLADDPDTPLKAEVEATLAALRIGGAPPEPVAAPPASAPALAPVAADLTPPSPATSPARAPTVHRGRGLAFALAGAGAALVAGAVVAIVVAVVRANCDPAASIGCYARRSHPDVLVDVR
jgi:tetratricopeptide (TPR) repeat protein